MQRVTIVLLAILFAFGCANEAPKTAEAAETPEEATAEPAAPEMNIPEGAEQFAINTGTINWKATEAVGGGHNGTITVKDGVLYIKEGDIVSGEAVIDMNTIADLDIKDDAKRAKLESHLKDTDFFEVNKFPEGRFVINEVKVAEDADGYTHLISGNLTLKDITKPVSVPANVVMEEGTLRAESAPFTINRTEWGVEFRSGILGTAKDKLINDDVEISLSLEAARG
jgi:polyisoprenoid-binding protein YceI